MTSGPITQKQGNTRKCDDSGERPGSGLLNHNGCLSQATGLNALLGEGSGHLLFPRGLLALEGLFQGLLGNHCIRRIT